MSSEPAQPAPSADRSGHAPRVPGGSAAGHEQGTLRCDRGCPNRTGVACGYIDRHGRACPSAWCPDHRAVVDGVAYCRRHAAIVEALGQAEAGGSMPELENRSPALVNWIGNDIDDDMRRLLERLRRDGETVFAHAVRRIEPRGPGTRRWSRSWGLRRGDVETLRIALEVDERSDPEIAVRVDEDVLVRSIAPWIGHRLRGEWVAPHVDQAERRRFNRDLCDLIFETVTSDRQAEPG